MQQEAPATELTTVFARIRGMLLSEDTATEAVHQLAQVARDLIGSALGAGVSLIDEDGRKTSTGATDALVSAADALQYDLGEGPCLSAWATRAPQRIEDIATESRWPRWSAAVLDSGVRSMLSVPLVHRERDLGAMKIYATVADAFGAREEGLLELLAGAAAVLLGTAQGTEAPHRLSASLKGALEDRRTIEVATGMLMERRGTDADSALSGLLAASRRREVHLAVIAREIVESHPDSDARE